MNKFVYGFLFAFYLGYIANGFISDSDFFLVAPAHADVTDVENAEDTEDLDLGTLLQDLDFRLAVKSIVEDCTVEDNKIHC
jgi:hypothetical protein